MQVFPSKLGSGVLIPILIVLGGTSILYAMEDFWLGIIINLVVAAFIFYMIRTTCYSIRDSRLFIRCGLYEKEVQVSDIIKILPSKNIGSAPAFSLDRLCLQLKKGNSILISPLEKEMFVKELKKINPMIQTE